MTVVDVSHLLGDERGTAFDQSTLMFASFDEGDVFNYDAATLRDFEKMLERDGKAATLEQALTLPLRRAQRSLVEIHAREAYEQEVETEGRAAELARWNDDDRAAEQAAVDESALELSDSP